MLYSCSSLCQCQVGPWARFIRTMPLASIFLRDYQRHHRLQFDILGVLSRHGTLVIRRLSCHDSCRRYKAGLSAIDYVSRWSHSQSRPAMSSTKCNLQEGQVENHLSHAGLSFYECVRAAKTRPSHAERRCRSNSSLDHLFQVLSP